MGSDPTARTLRLLSLLQSRAAWSAAELVERLEVSSRTLRRDADRLRQLGYAVQARPGPGSSYRLMPGVSVPPLLFDPDEITAVVAGLRLVHARLPGDDAAARALAKLDQVLPGRLRRRAAATDLAIEVLDDGDLGIAAQTVGVVADAVAGSGRVRFTYCDQHGRCGTRLVDPYRHVLNRGHWYLIGYDLDRDDWRTFRFDRVTDIERVPGTYRRRHFPDDSISHWLATDFGRRRG
jgi:predicted DNA-binding transcriptional regulator YafY